MSWRHFCQTRAMRIAAIVRWRSKARARSQRSLLTLVSACQFGGHFVLVVLEILIQVLKPRCEVICCTDAFWRIPIIIALPIICGTSGGGTTTFPQSFLFSWNVLSVTPSQFFFLNINIMLKIDRVFKKFFQLCSNFLDIEISNLYYIFAKCHKIFNKPFLILHYFNFLRFNKI